MARLSPYGTLAVRIYRRLIDPLLRPLRPKIAQLCCDLGAHEVLDIASATGAQCRALGRAGIEATGLDRSEPMIDIATRIGGRGVRYVQGSAYDLPFEDDSFDASLLLLALHEHTPEERTMMVREALRVVSPGGVVVIAEYSQPASPALHLPWQVIRWIESIAGGGHRAGFVEFVAHGGLDGLLSQHGLHAVFRIPSHFGTIGIAVVHA